MTESLSVSCTSVGFSVAVIDEDGMQQLHITEVKAEGLASAKGTHFFFMNKQTWRVYICWAFSVVGVEIQT